MGIELVVIGYLVTINVVGGIVFCADKLLSIKGGKRAMIMSNEYDKVFPMDILPEFLIKAVIAFDIDKMKVFFQDIDGPDNGGEFALDSVEVKVYRIGEGDGNWFNGTFKSDDVEVRLKKKE